MRKSHEQLAHDFFHGDEPGMAKDGRMHSDGPAFYSYETCIAQKFNFGKGPVVVCMLDRMTSTTEKHRGHLEKAIPPGWTVLRYPYPYDMDHAYPAQTVPQMVRCLQSEIKGYVERDMRTEGRRNRFREIVKTLRYLAGNAGVDNAIPDDLKERIETLEKACVKPEESLRKLKETIAEQKRTGKRKYRALTPWHEALEAFRPRLDAFLKAPLMEVVIEAFTPVRKRKWIPDTPRAKSIAKRLLETNGFFFRKGLHGGNPPEREDLADLGSPDRRTADLAYAWIMKDGRTVRTSLGVEVSVNHIRADYRVYDALEDKTLFIGHRIAGRYAVYRIEGGVMEIGCHRIPLEAVDALRKELFRKEEKLK